MTKCMDARTFHVDLRPHEQEKVVEWLEDHGIEDWEGIRAIKSGRDKIHLVYLVSVDGRIQHVNGEPCERIVVVEPQTPFPWPAQRLALQRFRR